MKHRGFSRRDFVSMGAVAAASVMSTAAAGQGTDDQGKKEKGMLNVIDFGAKGDGKADDTAAIQRALNAAGTTNGSVFIPQGTYLCSELKVPVGIGIHGLPAMDYRKGMGSVLKFKGGTKCLINLTGAYGAYLFGLCLHGGDIEGGAHGIMVDKPDYGTQEDTPRIDMCRIEHFTGDGIRLERIWCFVVRHSHCYSNKGCGLRVRGWDGFILDNWFSGNGMAGYAAYDENASNTLTGNRIEWNHDGGIIIHGGSTYNITGNYIDRSGRCGIALLPRGGEKNCHTLAITGNVIYRSAKPDWGLKDEFDSAHVRFEYVKGLVFTGNAMHAGRDDDGLGNYSPDYGIVAKGLECSIIRDNVLFEGVLKQVVLDQGEHGADVIIKENVGSLRNVG
jgi:hypothetical protein